MRNAFSKDYLVVAGQTSPEDALSSTAYPASGSYIDVSAYEWVNVVVHLGAIDSSDAPKLVLKQTTATNGGTLDTINSAMTHTAAADDDDEVVTFYLETANLADDHHFVTLSVASGVSNASYGDIMFYLGGARHQPVTQTTALLPTASQNIYAG